MLCGAVWIRAYLPSSVDEAGHRRLAFTSEARFAVRIPLSSCQLQVNLHNWMHRNRPIDWSRAHPESSRCSIVVDCDLQVDPEEIFSHVYSDKWIGANLRRYSHAKYLRPSVVIVAGSGIIESRICHGKCFVIVGYRPGVGDLWALAGLQKPLVLTVAQACQRGVMCYTNPRQASMSAMWWAWSYSG